MGVESLDSELLHGVRLDRDAVAGAQLLALALELAAGGEDVPAARRADGRGVAGPEDDFGERLDPLPVRALVGASRPGVEWNEVDLRGNAPEQPDQGLRLGKAVVDVLEHDVLEGDAPRVRQSGIGAAGSEEIRDRVLPVERNESVAKRVR